MLKKIPKIISPELMKELMEMGHADSIIFADANYPATSNGKKVIRLDSVEIPQLLEAVLPFFPLDNFVPNPVKLMKPMSTEETPTIWNEYYKILKKYDEEKAFNDFEYIERFDFYEMSKKTFLIVQTGTTARYANIVLQKGVI